MKTPRATRRIRTWDLERRIRQVWARATDHERETGARWYALAYGECAKIALDYCLPVQNVVGAVAAISPGNEWLASLRQARELVAWHQDGIVVGKLTGSRGERPAIGTYSTRNIEKALSCLDGETPVWPRGPKVTAFYRLILARGRGPWVCVDGHAHNIARGVRQEIRAGRTSRPEYRRTVLAYVRLAGKLGVLPATLQAATWITWKREGKEAPF